MAERSRSHNSIYIMPKGYTYILECSDGLYYTGSTVDIDLRITKHQNGQGSNHTKKRLPVKLVYLEEYQRIDNAFNREKQIQGWSRVKKETLILNKLEELNKLSECKNDSHYANWLRLRSASEKQLSSTKNKNLINKPKTYRSNGKLLLTGEYVVLDGAKALAIPTKYGQNLTIESNTSNSIIWKSYNELGEIWFEDEFLINDASTRLNLKAKNYTDISKRLIQILKATHGLNPEFLNSKQGYTITTQQDFNRLWGLGTSSTLVNNIANWAHVDAYKLLEKTFRGSGYDIACAQNDTPITYLLKYRQKPVVETIDFDPNFKSQLYFVYLNQKQNSRDGIASYKKKGRIDDEIINSINEITESMITCETLTNFENLIVTHEAIISKLIDQKPVKTRLFKDFKGAIKSLGAWGGDFILVTSDDDPKDYFNSKGFETVIPYSEMILN